MKTLARLLLFLTLFIASCCKDDLPENTSSPDRFPNSTGDFRKYSIRSFTGENQGFLEVRVISKSILTYGRTVSIWVYSYPDFADTVYIVSDGNTIEEYDKFPELSGSEFPFMRYAFPFEPGKRWAINSTMATDSVEVKSETSITVPAGTFDNSWQLDFIGTRYIGNYRNNSHYWFTPFIGISRMEYSVISLSPDKRNGIYELVEYRLR